MCCSDQKSSRKPRADSIRNRARLLAAASEVFSAGGTGASLEAVAKKAGVGIGTLYRHFPTREDLFLAVYQAETDELVTLAERLSGEPDAAEALREWLHASVHMIATKKGMVAALAPVIDSSSAIYNENGARMMGAVEAMTRRATQSGAIRKDVAPDDVMRTLIGVSYFRDQADWQSAVLRVIDIFVDGLKAGRQASKD